MYAIHTIITSLGFDFNPATFCAAILIGLAGSVVVLKTLASFFEMMTDARG